MPTTRRRRTRNLQDQFTAGKLAHLCIGADYFGDGYGQAPKREAQREDWCAHREEIIEAYNRRPYRPRPMPWAYYQFEQEETDHVK